MPCDSGLAAFPPPLSPVSHLRADGLTGPLRCLLWLPRARWPCLRLLRLMVLFVFVFALSRVVCPIADSLAVWGEGPRIVLTA